MSRTPRGLNQMIYSHPRYHLRNKLPWYWVRFFIPHGNSTKHVHVLDTLNWSRIVDIGNNPKTVHLYCQWITSAHISLTLQLASVDFGEHLPVAWFVQTRRKTVTSLRKGGRTVSKEVSSTDKSRVTGVAQILSRIIVLCPECEVFEVFTFPNKESNLVPLNW